MIIVVSGEGSTDIGVKGHSGDFKAGPMVALIEQLIEPIWKFSPLSSQCFEFVSESELNGKSKALNTPALRGKKRKGYETAFFFKNARVIARQAQELNLLRQTPSMAVLFRDTDGTRSTKNSERALKVKSMMDGFVAENFENGIPMIPKPTSEAWLICALKDAPYQNCAQLESLSGNTQGKNHPKKRLQKLLTARGIQNIHDTTNMILDGTIQAQSIQMPSYNEFRQQLEHVANKMLE